MNTEIEEHRVMYVEALERVLLLPVLWSGKDL